MSSGRRYFVELFGIFLFVAANANADYSSTNYEKYPVYSPIKAVGRDYPTNDDRYPVYSPFKSVQPPPAPIPHRVSRDVSTGYFNSIDVGDDIRLEVVNLPYAQKVVVEGYPDSTNRVATEVVHGKLRLRHYEDPKACDGRNCTYAHAVYPSPVYVKVYTPSLQAIHATGNCRVMLNGLKNGYEVVNVIADDDAKVNLRGVVNLQHVITAGNSEVDVQWVSSPHVMVRSKDSSCVVLAGVTRILDAQMLGSSQLLAQYLRAREVYVKTEDYAVAHVTPIVVLNGFAADYSDILYYKTPAYLTRKSDLSSNVMQMAYWN